MVVPLPRRGGLSARFLVAGAHLHHGQLFEQQSVGAIAGDRGPCHWAAFPMEFNSGVA